MRLKIGNYEEKLRFELSPSRKIYDNLDSVWMPHLMFLQKNNFRSKICNTDIHGLRFNSFKDIKRKTVFFNNNKKSSVLLGASTVFGIGSSCDEKTISSLLSDKKNHFINMGARAYSMFQEIILFLSFINNTNKIKNLVVFSGLNDVFLNYNKNINNNFPGPIYYNNTFVKNMNNIKTQDLLKNYFSNKKNKYSITKVNLEQIIQRNFTIYNLIKKSFNINVIFVLQPYLTWCKNYSSEEKKIIEYTKNRSDKYMYDKIASNRKKIYNLYKKFANLNKIPFFDSNIYIKKNCSKEDFLFVDYVHLNDYGNNVLKKMIKSIL